MWRTWWATGNELGKSGYEKAIRTCFTYGMTVYSYSFNQFTGPLCFHCGREQRLLYIKMINKVDVYVIIRY